MYADALLIPWLEAVKELVPGLRPLDGHTHLGLHDPSGFTATEEELLESLRLAGARALVFPMAEPDGYAEPNRRCASVASSSQGRLMALVRLVPGQDPSTMLREGLAAGARGIKLHPASDGFDINDQRLGEALAMANAARLPVVVHAGPELSGIAHTAIGLCHRYPGLHLVLAHCALTDLAWVWQDVEATPNLFFDTSWWNPAHLMALFRLVPPGRILYASDLPYGTPVFGLLATLRCGHQAGLSPEQLASVAGGQLDRLLEGIEPLDLGPPPIGERREHGPLLEILTTTLLTGVEAMQRGLEPGDALPIARHACKLRDGHPDAATTASVEEILDLYDEHRGRLPPRNPFTPGRDLILTATVVARTPSAPNSP